MADEAAEDLVGFLKGEAACDPHLADQLVLPMALARGTSRLTTSRITRHLPTVVRLVQEVVGCPVQVGGYESSSPGRPVMRCDLASIGRAKLAEADGLTLGRGVCYK